VRIITAIAIISLLGCQSAKKEADTPKETPAAVASTPEPQVTTQEIKGPQDGDELEPIYFKYNSSAIEKDAVEILKQNASDLQKNPSVQVQIEGHCDSRGSDEYNFHLGEKRASAAKQVLVKMGVAPTRIKIISYGKDKAGTSESVWSKSRRASFVYLQ
jgi:peptidoglycan-associated lipoprotein